MNIRPLVLSCFAIAVSTTVASVAHAGIDACGDIRVEASAECEVVGGIECMALCEPVAFEAQCAVNLEVECGGTCEGELSVQASCEADCQASCEVDCNADPGSFDCQGSCYGDCFASAQAQCEGEASGSTARAECEASVEASCDAQCEISCDATPPQVECAGDCEASCQGSCRAGADAYIDCQVECQGNGYAECKAELQGGCEVDCDTQEGALFCDGEYIDHGGNLGECVASLQALLNIEVEGYAEASCEGNACMAEAGFSCACTSGPGAGSPARDAALLTVAGLFVLGVGRRRRASARS